MAVFARINRFRGPEFAAARVALPTTRKGSTVDTSASTHHNRRRQLFTERTPELREARLFHGVSVN